MVLDDGIGDEITLTDQETDFPVKYEVSRETDHGETVTPIEFPVLEFTINPGPELFEFGSVDAFEPSVAPDRNFRRYCATINSMILTGGSH